MATIRLGSKSALLVVDLQVGVLAETWDAGRITENILRTIHRARAHEIPIVWVQHSDEEIPVDSESWQWVSSVKVKEGETVLPKSFNSAFEQTRLEESLEKLGATHLVLAGAATNWCIRSTAYAALERGYDVTLVADGHTTADIISHSGGKIPAQSIVAELNSTMRWLSYPGRISAVEESDLVQFHT